MKIVPINGPDDLTCVLTFEGKGMGNLFVWSPQPRPWMQLQEVFMTDGKVNVIVKFNSIVDRNDLMGMHRIDEKRQECSIAAIFLVQSKDETLPESVRVAFRRIYEYLSL